MKELKTKDIYMFWGTKGSSSLTVKDRNLKPLDIKKLINPNVKLLRQMHSNIGYNINANFKSFTKEGDFLVTNYINVSIGVTTADCAPIIFHDPKTKSIGIAHAGWKGTVNKISEKVIKKMAKDFGSNPKDILIWIGPSAKTCCYEVGAKFNNNLDKQLAIPCLIKKNNSCYFNQQAYNSLILQRAGICKNHINLDFNECTICNNNYGSYRRDGKKAPLQISYIMLN